jgi:NTE family protein
MQDHWQAGYTDAATTLAHEEVLTLPTIQANPAIYDFLTPRAVKASASIQESHP